MTNDHIAGMFSLLGKLLDIHGENSFKSKAYSSAAFGIEKLPEELQNMPVEKIAGIKGIGDAIAAKINEILTTGSMQTLHHYLEKTPAGVVEMLQIKGLGAKKIHTVWKEMGIETMGELLYACNENRLTLYKGFGAKTQENVKAAIEFFLKSKGSFLYQQVEGISNNLLQLLQQALAPARVYLTGPAAMHDDVVDSIDLITDADSATVSSFLQQQTISFTTEQNIFSFSLEEGMNVKITVEEKDDLLRAAFEKTADKPFLEAFAKVYPLPTLQQYASIEDFLQSNGIGELTPDIRRGSKVVALCRENRLQQIITPKDIKGIIHSHSNWSDGGYSIEEMAAAAKEKGFEYLVISDHSKAAFYANGLTEDRIKAQHQYIEELNRKVSPFKIFKSIECDILSEGQLDYSNSMLSTFDLVIASVHSNLKMTEEKAIQRLLAAIENPYTTILGHMTGRLLLSRAGYPVNHKTIIDACAANQVVIELNAHPRRLDMDWHWIEYALEKGVLISIDPDAHSISGFDDVRYGVLAARKGLLTAQHNLSSFSLPQFESFLQDIKRRKGI